MFDIDKPSLCPIHAESPTAVPNPRRLMLDALGAGARGSTLFWQLTALTADPTTRIVAHPAEHLASFKACCRLTATMASSGSPEIVPTPRCAWPSAGRICAVVSADRGGCARLGGTSSGPISLWPSEGAGQAPSRKPSAEVSAFLPPKRSNRQSYDRKWDHPNVLH